MRQKKKSKRKKKKETGRETVKEGRKSPGCCYCMLLGDKTASSILLPRMLCSNPWAYRSVRSRGLHMMLFFGTGKKKKLFCILKKALKRAKPSLNSHLCSITNETHSAIKRNSRLPVALCWIKPNNATIILKLLSTRLFLQGQYRKIYSLQLYLFFI